MHTYEVAGAAGTASGDAVGTGTSVSAGGSGRRIQLSEVTLAFDACDEKISQYFEEVLFQARE